MKKLLLTSLCVLSLFGGSAFSQQPEGPKSQSHCMPFSEIEPKITANGFSPVFLGLQNNHVSIGIIKNKDNNWVLLHFIYSQQGIIACEVDEGNDLAILHENDTTSSKGL